MVTKACNIQVSWSHQQTKLYGRHHDLHNICEISISQMAVDTFRFTQNFLSSITDNFFIAGIAYHWRHRFTHSPIFGGFCIALQFVLHCFACFVCLLRSPLLQFVWGLCYSSFMSCSSLVHQCYLWLFSLPRVLRNSVSVVYFVLFYYLSLRS